MLIGLTIRDVVLIEALDLAVGPGLTALTGETGAGKSIVLDALGLATGARAEAGLVRRGAAQASAAAVFAPPPEHPAWAYLEDKGLSAEPGEDLVLRRQVSTDGRSRAFVNDQAAGVAVLRELGAMLLEVHGQHETVGLLDPRTHRALLDGYGEHRPALAACDAAWTGLRQARARAQALADQAARAAAETEELTLRLAELDRLDPREGEEAGLAEERALLSAGEKTMSDIAAARDALGGEALTGRLAQALRAVERARDRALQAGVSAEGTALARVAAACAAVDRALIEAHEATAAVDAAAGAFDFEPGRLDKTEERLFALRGAARKLGVAVEDLPGLRVRFAEALRGIETVETDLAEARVAVDVASAAYDAAAVALSAARRAAGERLGLAVGAELPPLRLDKARFRVVVDPLADDRAGPMGRDRVAFEVSTNPGAPFGALDAIASGGELARFALALKAALAARGGDDAAAPVMIFDEVDQGVGGAVADAVGLRLRRLARTGQVLVVTHSPQVAARADTHWRVSKTGGEQVATRVEALDAAAREEEIARMLAGAVVTDAARAAARALMDA
ncbi:MAG TPA: DNA repair protein RecN [Caulobacteraceae bacterium]|jgi:DNA repair protein RecN (Recombination protein N)|nr:DNA repair protein RecN [Caulobacteraceae bacterium]